MSRFLRACYGNMFIQEALNSCTLWVDGNGVKAKEHQRSTVDGSDIPFPKFGWC